MELLSKQKAKEREDDWDYLYTFLGRYFGMVDKRHEIMREFNDSQHTLLVYSYLDSQLCNGGFLQLIQNGYAKDIFDDPFSDEIKAWGAIETAKIVENAKKIYQKHKEKLEETTETISDLYEDKKEFEQLEKQYYSIKK
jgi:hypothetical protein